MDRRPSAMLNSQVFNDKSLIFDLNVPEYDCDEFMYKIKADVFYDEEKNLILELLEGVMLCHEAYTRWG